ncbi:glycoside hydrolase family 15 protein [Herbiconiux sp. YIM B11900]|uniref:glycoside hydrolase family 15 protein n=1 Tax=Herbiconiux sp. YIM B11900 TaxID=3404131 RepID=UPI003F83784A
MAAATVTGTLALAAPAQALPPGDAPGAPGVAATWTSGQKQGLGTATSLDSKVWYTLGAGTATEIFYPSIDRPQTTDLQFIVTDGSSRTSVERDDTTHQIVLADPHALEYRQVDTAKDGSYRISKTYITDSSRASVLIATRFEQLSGTTPLHLFVLFNPSIDGNGNDDTGSVSGPASAPVLTATGGGSTTSALASSVPFGSVSNGYSGSASDGFVQLRDAHTLSSRYPTASTPGNVVQTAEIPVARDTTFALGLSFGTSAAAAVSTVQASLSAGFGDREIAYRTGWQSWFSTLKPDPSSVTRDPELQKQYDVALMAMSAHEDKTHRGAFAASLSTPWGQANSGSTPGYHAVWARDLYNTASALLVAGDRAAATRALDYILTVQERADGSIPHNSMADGSSTGLDGLQYDEFAFPAVLAGRLGATDASRWVKIKLTMDYLVSHGPSTPQERWEEQSGYSPSTIAAEIAGLVSAADIARINGDTASAKRYLDTADLWQASIESWTVTHTGTIATPHYERIDPIGQPDTGSVVNDTNGAGSKDARDLIDAGFLELTSLGVKPADDLVVAASVGVVDSTLKTTTPSGPAWYRYNQDGYGEHADGSPFNGTAGGIGRPWPVLTGERGQYEVANGRDGAPYLASMAAAANEGYLIPEQVWDSAALGHFTPGEATDSAAPLAWAMAKYVLLANSISAGRNVETPALVSARYAGAIDTTFTERASTVWGENVFVVGSIPALGNWDPAKAIRLSSAGYPDWSVRVSLPAGTAIEYKFIKVDGAGKVVWESGSNRQNTLPTSGDITYTSSWK